MKANLERIHMRRIERDIEYGIQMSILRAKVQAKSIFPNHTIHKKWTYTKIIELGERKSRGNLEPRQPNQILTRVYWRRVSFKVVKTGLHILSMMKRFAKIQLNFLKQRNV